MKTNAFFFRSFAKVALVPYIGGTIAHVLRLIYQFPIEEAPYSIHWGIVLFGGYACTGFLWYMRQIDFRGIVDKILYGLVIVHLGGSVVMHTWSLITRSNDWIGRFSLEYSYFAIFYFVGLGWYCWSLVKRIQWMRIS